MSWIFGALGADLLAADRSRLSACHDPPLHVSESNTHYLAVGGLPETCHTGAGTDAPASGWAVVGLGLQRGDEGCRVLTAEDWHRRLAPPTPDFDALDGHFVAVRWHPAGIECFIDQIGLRACYVTRRPNGVLLSTRLDWLARLVDAGIDYRAFGPHWQMIGRFQPACFLEEVEQLPPGAHARCSATGVEVTATPWQPALGRRPDAEALPTALKQLLAPDRPMSLGLSGGLDSRLLLALRLAVAPDRDQVRTHVFGPHDHPDVHLSERIAADEDLPHQHFHEPLPDADTCLALLRNHVARAGPNIPASAVLGLRYYPILNDRGLLMLDGGFGEIGRHRMMNRLLRRGRRALLHRDVQALVPWLRLRKADVFAPDTIAHMEQGARDQLAARLEDLPDPAHVGVHTFVDLFAIYTRLPFVIGLEQPCLDEMLPNYMPFVQPSLLQAVFDTPLRLRREGRLYRHLIRRHCPSLQRHALVSGPVTYPYALRTVPAYVWTRVKTHLGLAYTDHRRHAFLHTLKPYLLDTIRSREVRTYAPYDQAKLVRLVEGFYEGRHGDAAAVDQWLTFEMWRQVMQGGS